MFKAKIMTFSVSKAISANLVDDIKIDFPMVYVSEKVNKFGLENEISLNFSPNEIVEERLHYYVVGYVAAKMRS